VLRQLAFHVRTGRLTEREQHAALLLLATGQHERVRLSARQCAALRERLARRA
jgi:hypothetical protein